ncbi:MAG: hypothetical protein EXS59_01970 [Candidatus Taylorbacteria bacterium]|nr:hypothetical protein [Candidatus Taylorbacteria bacterium]
MYPLIRGVIMHSIKSFKKIVTVIFLASFFLGGVHVFAQNWTDVTNRRAELQRELDSLQKEIDAQQQILNEKRDQSASLQRDIDILNAKIKRSELSIKARAISIQSLSEDINDKGVTIGKLDNRISHEQDVIASLLRQTNELDSYSLVEVVLKGENISKFFEDVSPLITLNQSLMATLARVRDTKDKTSVEKQQLEDKKAEQVSLQALQQLEKKRTEQEQAQKKMILTVSKGLESLYKKMLAQTEQSAAKIRAELFTLSGSVAIPFEKALEYANIAGKKTGVRPALILGIIAEESNLGENVGKGTWRVDMKAPRDTDPFLDITRRLGLNPDNMPVSKKPWYGYGGAMGPAQFIPSTWVLYEARIAKMTGHNPPNPWDPYDAFTASSILLMDNGADKRTYSAERLAALRYLAGWTNATKRAYAFYGDDVMELAAKYQKQIDILSSQ